MSLRTVAEETLTAEVRATSPDPTGWAVWMYSSTTARRMEAFLSSSMRAACWWSGRHWAGLALDDTECHRRHPATVWPGPAAPGGCHYARSSSGLRDRRADPGERHAPGVPVPA